MAPLGASADLLVEMTRADFRLRDQGTLLGFLWSLLHPLLMFAVLQAVFGHLMGPKILNFPAYLLIGLIFWNFFSTAVGTTILVFRKKAALVKNARIPCGILVASSVGTVLLSHLLELAVLLPFLLWLGCPLAPAIWFVPVVVALAAGLALGASFLLSTLAVFCRDIERIWSIASLALFFLTPVFYRFGDLPAGVQPWVRLNPATHLVAFARACLLYGELPAARHFALFTLGVAAILAAGYAVLRKFEPRFAETL